MDENQRQDWWPEERPAGTAQNPEQNTPPAGNDPAQEPLREAPYSYEPGADSDHSPDQNLQYSDSFRNQQNQSGQQNSDNYWNQQNQSNQQNSDNYWNQQNQSNQQNSDNYWNQQSQSNQQNSDNYWNQQNQSNRQNSDNYWNQQNRQNAGNGWNQQNYGYQPQRPLNNAMAIASLVMGILSIVLICCGLSYCFGALGIIFALLSRKNGPMESQAKIGLGLSIGGTVFGLLTILMLLIGNSSFEILQEYQRFYNEYEENPYFDSDSPFDSYPGLDNFEDWYYEVPDSSDSL
ncbi:MAG: DUF4190 domain-containing protein [Clostridiales bacterium]|nr:DUF4190 domain-containing protein [Clostridiales bacterium]